MRARARRRALCHHQRQHPSPHTWHRPGRPGCGHEPVPSGASGHWSPVMVSGPVPDKPPQIPGPGPLRAPRAGRAGCCLNAPPSPGTATLQHLAGAQHSGGKGRCKARRQGPKLQAGSQVHASPSAPCPPRRPPALWAQRSRRQGNRRECVVPRRRLCGLGLGEGVGAASEQQGLLLEVVPLPERQAVKLLHAHPEHLLELRGRQVSLQRKGNPRGA